MQTLCDELEEMENLRISRKNNSPYAFPVVVEDAVWNEQRHPCHGDASDRDEPSGGLCRDLLVHNPTEKDYMRILNELFSRLQQANFAMRPACSRGKDDSLPWSLVWRGSKRPLGCTMSQAKERARSFSSLVGYHKEFIPYSVAISALLYDLVHTGNRTR
ncbi:hypothetical protein PoB_004309000 [Plakobranchus ocellatus]|uniref:Uncharacterized protein n=1 Tax=Plakobranchus ocellatus TaxID=259542 RepID=A0AAV4B7L4_9GAST|nr:hypothetical protein PoB_004309000 [Plakobranchus ocellatus]